MKFVLILLFAVCVISNETMFSLRLKHPLIDALLPEVNVWERLISGRDRSAVHSAYRSMEDFVQNHISSTTEKDFDKVYLKEALISEIVIITDIFDFILNHPNVKAGWPESQHEGNLIFMSAIIEKVFSLDLPIENLTFDYQTLRPYRGFHTIHLSKMKGFFDAQIVKRAIEALLGFYLVIYPEYTDFMQKLEHVRITLRNQIPLIKDWTDHDMMHAFAPDIYDERHVRRESRKALAKFSFKLTTDYDNMCHRYSAAQTIEKEKLCMEILAYSDAQSLKLSKWISLTTMILIAVILS